MPRRLLPLIAFAFLLLPSVSLAQSPGDRILVMPFENVRREGTLFWLGEGAATLLTDDLNALGAAAITRQERDQALERLQVPPAAALTDATVIRIGQLVGAASVVIGSLQLDDGTLTIRARNITLENGRVQSDTSERGPLPELFAIVERISRRIAPASRRPSDEVERTHPPLAVFENFIKGLLAETPDTAVGYLEAALKQQPGFARARLALWDVYTDQGDDEEALKAVLPAVASKDGARASYLAGLSQLSLKRYDEAFKTFKALADADATPAIMNNLGVVQLRRGSGQAGQAGQAGLPTYYFTKAADADLDDPDYAFNLGYAYFLDHDNQAAIYWLRETVRRNPADGDAHFVLGAALAAAGSGVEAARERELARRLSSVYEERDKRAAPGSEVVVPRGLERVKQGIELPHARRIETRIASSEQRSQQELAAFYLNNGRRLFEQENDRQALDELNRALYLSPYLAEAHLLLGRIHLRNGRVHDAIDAFKISLWSAETAEGHAALGEAYRQNKDLTAARAEAERALALDRDSAEARQLLARLDGR
jgi:tetratricopeptide (TPR) repeat protein